MASRILKTWTRCEKRGEGAVEEVARRASRSFRNANRMIVSSFVGGGAGDLEIALFGPEFAICGGDGVEGCIVPAPMTDGGGFRAGSEDADGEPSSESDANAVSRSLEC